MGSRREDEASRSFPKRAHDFCSGRIRNSQFEKSTEIKKLANGLWNLQQRVSKYPMSAFCVHLF